MAETQQHQGQAAPVGLVWAALGSVYVIWGSTYLAIRVGIETLPPMLMASVRFLVAGTIMYAVAIRMGDREGDRPTRQQWKSAAIIGTLTPAQMMKIAQSNTLLCRFRMDDDLVWGLLTNHGKAANDSVSRLHASILMAGRHQEAA